MMLKSVFRKRVAGLMSGILLACTVVTPVMQVNATGIFNNTATVSAATTAGTKTTTTAGTETTTAAATVADFTTDSTVFDPVTQDMISSGVLTPSQANQAEDGTSITVIGQVVYKYGSNGTADTVILEDVENGEITGFQIYGKGYVDSFNIGDVVTIGGSVSTYGKVKQLKPDVLPAVVKTAAEAGKVIPAQELTIAQLKDGGDSYVSEYVKIKDVVLGAYNKSNTKLTDADTNTINIYKGAEFPEGIAEGDSVNCYGAFSKYNTTYQLRNGSSSDYKKPEQDTETGDGDHSGNQTGGEEQSGKVSVDQSVIVDYASWITGKDLGDSLDYVSEAGADQSAALTVYKADTKTAPVFTTKSTTGTNYYLGAQGLGSEGNAGYYQMNLTPSSKYGNMTVNFSMKGSGTAAKEWTLSYSKDGITYTDVDTYTIEAKSTVYEYTAILPEDVNGAKNIVIRLTPGTQSINKGTIAKGGNHYLSDVRITASPVVSDQICQAVVITPEVKEVMSGQELTMTTKTEGASIYYSFNGGEKMLYNADQKPVLTQELLENGVKVAAYAVLDGKTDSIEMMAEYKQLQAGTVKATPNGGSVAKGTKVTLTTDTDGADIVYSKDNGETWENYNGTDRLTLNELPAEYQVKTVKAGYKDGNVSTLSYTERKNDKYNVYFGQLHAHTSYSDGAGTCEEAFTHAATVKNLDFLAVTDHSNSFDNESKSVITDGSMSTEWIEGHELADKYTSDKFVGMYGFEMTWSNGLGHVNTFNTEGFQSRTQSNYSVFSTALQNYYATLKTVPDSITQFNHPGTQFGDFSDFAYYDAEIDNLITMIEVGNGEGAIGSSGYFPSYEYYQRALDKGWHVAPTNNQDNHKGLWGDANTARSVVLADSLSRENIYDAMRNYRVYATEDNDLNIYYTLDGNIMGSILESGQTGSTVDLNVEVKDLTDAKIGTVSVITNGGLVLDTKTVESNQETVDFTIDNNYSFYYIKVVEPDGDIAVTAPVWVGDVEAAGINSISTQEVIAVQNEAVNVDLELYNNETTDLKIDSIEFSVGDEVVHTVDLAKADMTNVAPNTTAAYSFDYTYAGVGDMELNVTVKAEMNGASKVYNSVLKLSYVKPEMVTNVVIDGTHYNDYVTGYYGGNVGNFTSIAGDKNIRVSVVKDEITPEILADCSLLIISAPAKKSGTSNTGNFEPSEFSDEFIAMVKNYTDKGGTLITCGLADYQDAVTGQTATQMNKLLSGIGATTKLNSDEGYDADKNSSQPYRLHLTNYNKDSEYLAGALEGQEYSAYSGCTVALDEAAVNAGRAEALVTGFDTTYSIDCKDENGNSVANDPVTGSSPVYVEAGNVVALAHETLTSGASVFVSGAVLMSDFEVKAELDNNWDLPYLNRTIMENILDQVKVELPVSSIEEVRSYGQMGDVYTIEGYVTAGTSVKENTFFDAIYVQDETAGITIFPFSQSGVAVGTKIRITGYVDAYQGDKELQVMNYEIIPDDTHVYAAKKMTTADAMDYEKNGGRLVQVEGKVTKVLASENGASLSQLWIKDASGVDADIFIDGYILSAATGKNELGKNIKVGDTVSAAGIVYAHPEGTSDVSVTCLRVRNCDEIVKKTETEKPSEEATTKPVEEVTTKPAEEATTKPTETAEKPSSDPTAAETTTQDNNGESDNKQTVDPVTEQTTAANTEAETDADIVIEKADSENAVSEAKISHSAVVYGQNGNEVKAADVVLKVQAASDETITRMNHAFAEHNIAAASGSNVYMYDVDLSKNDGTILKLAQGKVGITFNKDEAVDYSQVDVYAYHLKDNGELEVLNAVVTEAGIYVEATGFSPYAIVTVPKQSLDTVGNGVNSGSVKAGDTTDLRLYVIMLLVCMISVTGVCVYSAVKKRKNPKA